jgi:hypothetical protein
MAHFAKLDDNNIVVQVIVVHNNELLDENGQESEAKGVAFCENRIQAKWIQTSYSGSFRKNFAGVGHTYDNQRDAFIPPKRFPSWVLNENNYNWESPVPYPQDGKIYFWNEETFCWNEITQ